MMPADYYDVFQCPNCDAIFRDVAARGGNTFGAIHWSDGWCDAPLLDRPPPVVLCPGCAAAIWRRDLHAIGRGMYDSRSHIERLDELDSSAVAGDWHVAPHVECPTLDGLVRAADALARDHGEAEREARLWIWWRVNDSYRDGDATWVPLSQRPSEHLASVNRLRTLLDVNGREERLMLAELHRESEQYRECLALLGTYRGGRLRRIVTTLRKLAESGDSRLVSL